MGLAEHNRHLFSVMHIKKSLDGVYRTFCKTRRYVKKGNNKLLGFLNMYNNQKGKYPQRLKLLVKTVIDKYNENVTDREQSIFYDPEETFKQTTTQNCVNVTVSKLPGDVDTREKIFFNIKHNQTVRNGSAVETTGGTDSLFYQYNKPKRENLQVQDTEVVDTQTPFSPLSDNHYAMFDDTNGEGALTEENDTETHSDGYNIKSYSVQNKLNSKLLDRRKKIVVTLPGIEDDGDSICTGNIQIYVNDELPENGEGIVLKEEDKIDKVGKLQYNHRNVHKRACEFPNLHPLKPVTPYILCKDFRTSDKKDNNLQEEHFEINSNVMEKHSVIKNNTTDIPRVTTAASIPIAVRTKRTLLSIKGSNLQCPRNLQSSESSRSAITQGSRDQEGDAVGNRLSLLILHRKRAKAQSSKFERTARVDTRPRAHRHECVYSRFDGTNTSLPRISKTKDPFQQREKDDNIHPVKVQADTVDEELRHCRFEVSRATDISEFVYQVLMDQDAIYRNYRSRHYRSALSSRDTKTVHRRTVLSGNLTDKYRAKHLRPKFLVKPTSTVGESYKARVTRNSNPLTCNY